MRLMRSKTGQCVKVILIVMWLSFIAFGYSCAKTARDIAQESFPSVVMLLMEDENGQPYSLGSGFFVDQDLVATNLHVVEGASRGYAKIVGEKQKYDIVGVVGVDLQRDLVLLRITESYTPFISLGDSRRVAVVDKIYAIGNPQGLEGTFSQGIISGVREVGRDTLFQITAAISPGSSGGPVLNAEGKVIGVTVATFTGGQNLNFAIPSSYLALLLQNMKPVVSLSSKPLKREKSILDDIAGPYTEAIIGSNFTWQNQLYGLGGDYSFTLRNRLREPVQDIYCLVIFYDENEEPLDVDLIYYESVIPAGLAERVTGSVDQSVQRLTTPASKDNRYLSSLTPSTKVEFRILDFSFLE